MFRSTVTLNAAAKSFALVPDTIVHDGIAWSKVALAPNRHAWFFAEGKFILAREEGSIATDATVYAPTDELDMGRDSNRRGSKFTEQGDIRHLAADQVTEAQLMLPETPGVGPARAAMKVALVDNARVGAVLPTGILEPGDRYGQELVAKADASRARAIAAQERLYAKVGRPRRPARINWHTPILEATDSPVAAVQAEPVIDAEAA